MRVSDKIPRDRLETPLDETAVCKFEVAHSISLPNDYRRFLIEVANGGFEGWLEKRLSGPRFLYDLVENWGPSPNIWWASHAMKKMFVSDKGNTFAQSNPLCLDCTCFISRLATVEKRVLAVRTPKLDWHFEADGSFSHKVRA